MQVEFICICDAVSVVIHSDAELDESSVADVGDTEEVIVSQWKEVSADEKHQMRKKFDEILRPLGFETSLLVIRRANSLAIYFFCENSFTLTGLHDRWSSDQLRPAIQSLFTTVAPTAGQILIKRLSLSPTDYARCLAFLTSLEGKQNNVLAEYYTVSQKTSHLWLAITLTHMNGF